MKNKKIIIIIPARGGSKRIFKKNIKKICGQPMIYWPLMQLSKFFKPSQIIVSTDSKEIKKIVERKGIEVPFLRPQELADDYTSSTDVVRHSLNWYEKNFYKVDYVIMIYPTAVLLNLKDIKNAYKSLVSDKNCDLIFSGTNYMFPIQRSFFIDKKGYAKMHNPKYFKTRSQDLPEAMHDAGQFYIFKSSILRKGKDFPDISLIHLKF